jgi:glutaminyl-peptide cyclotransferase
MNGQHSPAAALVQPRGNHPVPMIPFRVTARYRHDPDAFTQGLDVRDGVLYESTGLLGQSEVRMVEKANGQVVRRRPLPVDCFGEGLAVVGDTVVQLTWRERRGFVYDRCSLQPLGTFTYPTEGWGLTSFHGGLLMSDGSSTLYTLDPTTFRQESLLNVTMNGAPLSGLNDLQWVDDLIFANVYPTDRIVLIDAASGRVVGMLDLSGLPRDPRLRCRRYLADAAVLNGIAYDPSKRGLLVTGKLWESLYRVELAAP